MRALIEELSICDDRNNAAQMPVIRKELKNDGVVGRQWCEKERLDIGSLAMINKYLLSFISYKLILSKSIVVKININLSITKSKGDNF